MGAGTVHTPQTHLLEANNSSPQTHHLQETGRLGETATLVIVF